MRARGVIEGFYGAPWTHEERLDLIRFCGAHGLDTWVHAPKDDPYHRRLWREPYPDEELGRFGELVREAERHGVDFVWAIAPGLDVRPDDDAEVEAALAKCDQLRRAGVQGFHLLWDDIERTERSAEIHATFSNRFAAAIGAPLVVCPMGYAGTGETPYRRAFGSLLDAAVAVYWTGPEVVSPAISRADLDEAAASFGGHELLLWDNYPVNDFARDTLFLGPLRGRDAALADGLRGIVANGMLQAVPSKLALATVAEWARAPAEYEPLAAFERALSAHGDEVVESLRALAPPAQATPPADLAALADALAPGVGAATALALLEPFT